VEEAVKRASRIIAVSHSTKNDIIELLGAPKNKIDVIYEAADPFFRHIPREEARSMLASANIQVPEQFIFFVGTIEPRKNLTTLIRSYHFLKERYNHHLPLLLAGASGWLADEVHELVAELKLEDSVYFLGRTRTEHILALYNLATVLAHPAHYEGFGLPPLEAMACGSPVVCSDAGSLPEVVGDAALMVPPEDVEAWAAALHRVIADENLRREMIRKGRERVKLFSWEKAARETLETYHKAVA
jgi:glycosyltransferase involved in cell wall biosynthesis